MLRAGNRPQGVVMAPVPRNVWSVLNAVFTFMAGLYAAHDETLLFWAMLSLWFFFGFLLAACKPGEKPAR